MIDLKKKVKRKSKPVFSVSLTMILYLLGKGREEEEGARIIIRKNVFGPNYILV